MYYVLGPTKMPIPVSEDKFLEWVKEFGHVNKMANDAVNKMTVSTVFLGLDHNFDLDKDTSLLDYKPVLFETMVFSDQGEDLFQARYSSYEEAMKGHRRVVSYIQMNNQVPYDLDSINDLAEDAGII